MPSKFIFDLPDVLGAPDLPNGLPIDAKWLAGEGVGSWFVLSLDEKFSLVVNRYNKAGIHECEKIYLQLSGFDISADYSVTYPSFCNKITIVQDGIKITLTE